MSMAVAALSVSTGFKIPPNAIVILFFSSRTETKERLDLISISFVWMDIGYFPVMENVTGS